MLALDPRRVKSLLTLAWGFEEPYGYGGQLVYQWTWLPMVGLGKDSETQSLFYNAMLFVRIMWPSFIGVGIRWGGRGGKRREFLQVYAGWKLNGRLGAAFRIQSDESGARGTMGPNSGQATGWRYGPK